MRKSWIFAVAGFALLSALLVQVGPAQQGKTQKGNKAAARQTSIPPGDWPLYSRDLMSDKFSPLTQINTTNVAQLAQAWTYRPPAPPPPPDNGKGGGKGKGKGGGGGIGGEVTPIVVNGVMYVPAGPRVVALEADSGKEIWTYNAPGAVGNRAVGYWPGDGTNPPRVLFTTGRNMMALNANTGVIDPGFGKEGTVEIGINWGGAPYIYKNLVILGNNNGESTEGPPGDTRVYDARTGSKLWDFHSIAQPGDPGHDTWLNDGWKKRAGVNVWGWYFTVDEARDLVYMPFGSAAGNYWGGDRPGANLYANSIVAVDANSGKYKWHFQVVHHDLWDTDLPAAPSLFDVVKDGRRIPAMAVISKNALMFILNRETGEPIHGVVERPVPKGDAPGEWYSPTQPFPVKPPPLTRNSFDKAKDMVTAADTTPEHVKACEEMWEKAGGYYNAGPFTPFPYHEAGTPPKSAVQFPGVGAPNWGGTAADPSMGYVFVATNDSALTGWIEKKVEGGNYGSGNGSPQPYDRGSVSGPGPYSGFTAGGFPCNKPPWGHLYAINANTGDIAWQVVLGINERLPEGKQNVGAVNGAGPAATAGGLLFTPSSDSRFRAFDTKTGKQLWEVKLDSNLGASPMTYQGKNGKQYVAGVVGGAVVAFALP
ncbi:MAG: PQQ-binding-like beta-propeller repeat protein [Acidobacteriia bacterium]|nr:PQQ-binding-like beta-propeller repeat protein [Terriglobia bacterium]